MKIVSWNVNGIRAAAKKGLFDVLNESDADVYGFQETKAQDDQIKELFEDHDYIMNMSSAVKKGYSGTAVITKKEPITVIKGMGIEEHDQEGRICAVELDDLYVVNVYVPNSQNGLKRLDYRKRWDKDFLDFMKDLGQHKPILSMGDFNVCHQAIDIARPKSNYNKTPGYTQDEIDGMSKFLDSGLNDSFRIQHPDTVQYSWWSYRANARANNVGWRLDYCLLSDELMKKCTRSFIQSDIHGSDHCPVGVEIEI